MEPPEKPDRFSIFSFRKGGGLVDAATSRQVVYGRLAAPSCDRYAARFDFVSFGSGAGSETGAGLSSPSTVR